MKLQEALEGAEQFRRLGRFFFDFAGWMQQIKLAPALTVALLMIGFAGGSLTTYRIARNEKPGVAIPTPVSEAGIAGIESVVPTDANHVLIRYDTLHQQTAEGTTDDPRIQQLLLMATQNLRNSGVRLDSIDLLKSQAQDNRVRDALITSLRYDKNPGVRLQALDALKGYIRGDVRVRDAALDALLHDDNAGVRSEAIGLLDQVRADSSVREALKALAHGDKDKFIRTQSRRYLENTPELD
ncbi:MAG TPA: HEAT repeat domain-containing protein [Terriglobales bacterium]|nr:HEAT repeat domain-containing protein [Terriglobales bacterium]